MKKNKDINFFREYIKNNSSININDTLKLFCDAKYFNVFQKTLYNLDDFVKVIVKELKKYGFRPRCYFEENSNIIRLYGDPISDLSEILPNRHELLCILSNSILRGMKISNIELLEVYSMWKGSSFDEFSINYIPSSNITRYNF